MKNKSPKIRFNKNGEWQNHKFGDLITRVSLTTDSKEFPMVEYADVKAGHGTLNKDINSKMNTKRGTKFIENDILFGKLRPYLKNWLLSDFEGIAVGDWWVLRTLKSHDHRFVYSLIQSEKFLNVANLSTGTKMPRSDWKTVHSSKYFVPQIKEQTQIGHFFKELDELIELQQTSISNLEEMKRGFVLKLLVVDQEKIPLIRISNFKSKWKSDNIDNIYEVTRGKVLAKTLVSKNKTEKYIYPVYSSQTMDNGLMGYYTKYLFKDAITWTTDGANAGTVVYRKGKFYSTNVNGVLLSGNGMANETLAEIINLVAWKYVSHVGNPKLMNNVMSNIIISYPDLEEQELISNFLRELDHLIELENKELKLLQEMKKGFLKKMFV